MARSWISDRIQIDTRHGSVPDTHEDWCLAMLESGARDRLLYIPVSGWYIYRDKKWEKDPEGVNTRGLVLDFATCYREAPYAEDDEDKRRKLKILQKKAEQNGHITAVASVLSTRLAMKIEELDADPWVMNTPAGVLDLRTRKLLMHSPSHRMTMLTNGSYDPEALIGSRWLQVIREIVPDDERRRYLQEMTGIALVGKQIEQLTLLYYGPTARNGKSTVGEAIQHAMGSYAGVGDPAILTNADRHPENLAALYGKRMVAFSELPEDKVLAAAGFKRLSGNDTITARFLFKDRFDYKPGYSLAIRSNDLPYVPGDDEGTWRRIKVVTFDQQFKDSTDDRNLQSALQSDEEASAILTWAVEGLARYLNRAAGSQYWEPACVSGDTKELRNTLDPVGQFLEEFTALTPSEQKSFASYHAIWEAYAYWWGQHSEKKPMSQPMLTRKLRKRPGFVHTTDKNRRGVGNIILSPVPEIFKQKPKKVTGQ